MKTFMININEKAIYSQSGTYAVQANTEEEAIEKLRNLPLNTDSGEGIEHTGDNEIDYNQEQILERDFENINSIEIFTDL